MAEGPLFGKAALPDKRPRPVIAGAAEDAVVRESIRGALDEIGEGRPRIAIRVVARLARITLERKRETGVIPRPLDASRDANETPTALQGALVNGKQQGDRH